MDSRNLSMRSIRHCSVLLWLLVLAAIVLDFHPLLQCRRLLWLGFWILYSNEWRLVRFDVLNASKYATLTRFRLFHTPQGLPRFLEQRGNIVWQLSNSTSYEVTRSDICYRKSLSVKPRKTRLKFQLKVLLKSNKSLWNKGKAFIKTPFGVFKYLFVNFV